MRKALLLSMLVGAAALAVASPASAAGECPAIGASSDCSVLITINPDNSISVTVTGIGPYDGVEDSLVGVFNNSATPLTALTLSGSSIFGFDGDGAGLYATGGPFGPTGYEGPNTSFLVVDSDNGTVLFGGGGVAAGASAWFSLEENLADAANPITVTPGGVPEPSTWAMMLLGFGAIGTAIRRRSKVKLLQLA